MRLTLGQFLALQVRLNAKRREPVAQDAVEHESDLHQQILDWCKRNGWLCLHGSMAHRSRRTLGEPDMVVILPQGRVALIECKSRTGKLSTDQLALKMLAEKLGHTVHVVRSLQEFVVACLPPS